MTDFHLFITILGAYAFADTLFSLIDRIERGPRK